MIDLRIIPITAEYDAAIEHIITSVGKEFGAIGDGFGPSDAEVAQMSQHYHELNNSQYFIALINDEVVGGSGIAPFDETRNICELRKLFILPKTRGLGVGKALTLKCLEFAKQKNYQQCYLDTLANMDAAIGLYLSLNFQHLDKPLTGTIHDGCDVWMLKNL